MQFFAPQTIFTFQGSLPEFRWHDQSELPRDHFYAPPEIFLDLILRE